MIYFNPGFQLLTNVSLVMLCSFSFFICIVVGANNENSELQTMYVNIITSINNHKLQQSVRKQLMEDKQL